MSSCCPPRLGCNAPRRDEPCVLELCRAICDREPAAATVLERWQAWQEAVAEGCSGAESRFQRRAYERAREAAMGVLVMALARARRSQARRPGSTARRGTGTSPRRRSRASRPARGG